MMLIVYFALILIVFMNEHDAARILAIYPTPSISHQVVFRPLTLELVKRGHEVVVLTTDPMFGKGEAPNNLTEIDVHEVSYNFWREQKYATDVIQGDGKDIIPQIKLMLDAMVVIIEKQLHNEQVQDILKGEKKFDLLINEAISPSTLIFAHILKVPVIQASSMGLLHRTLNLIGAPTHPFLYPSNLQWKIFNLSIWDKLSELYRRFQVENIFTEYETSLDAVLKKVIGSNVPSITEMKKNVDLIFSNVFPLWDMNRPVPPNLIYLGGLHQLPQKDLPKDLKLYLDSSENGVIYISFGTNADPDLLPPQKIQILINVFSKLPYDVLWKWNRDELPGRTENIKISKWLPQADVLRHPKIKMFITQGGLQSTDEAITAGVPMIGIPMLGDQWFNVEQYIHHGIGVRVDMEIINEEILGNAVNEILNNESYRDNIIYLRNLILDQPQTPLERAVWWTEYVIRHGGARHLRSSAANISWAKYLELELIFFIVSLFFIVIITLILIVKKSVSKIKGMNKEKTS